MLSLGTWSCFIFCEENMFVFVVVLFLKTTRIVQGQAVLSTKGDTVMNMPVVLVCKPVTETSTVIFTDNKGSIVGSCVTPTLCSSVHGYNVSQNTVEKETYLKIQTCSRNVEGDWYCFQKEPCHYKITCLDPPATVQIKQERGHNVTCQSECTPEIVRFKFELLEASTMKHVYNTTDIAANGTSVGCNGTRQRTYSASFELLNAYAPGKTVKIKCYAIAEGITESKYIPFTITRISITLEEGTEHKSRLSRLSLLAVWIAVVVVIVVAISSVIIVRRTMSSTANNYSSIKLRSSFKHTVTETTATPTEYCSKQTNRRQRKKMVETTFVYDNLKHGSDFPELH